MNERKVPDSKMSQVSTRSYLLNTDGSGTGTLSNPSEGAIGVVLREPGGRLLESMSKAIGPATNTTAEYRALVEGLMLARRHSIDRIRVFLDSELVVDQMNGVSQVRAEHLRSLHAQAKALFNEFANKRISWVPRKWNQEADALAAQALPSRTSNKLSD